MPSNPSPARVTGNPRITWVNGNPRTVGTYAASDPTPTYERTPMPAAWVLDKAADLKLNGGYTPKMLKRTGVCPTCYLARSANGTCGC